MDGLGFVTQKKQVSLKAGLIKRRVLDVSR